jgi:hypothetical protein
MASVWRDGNPQRIGRNHDALTDIAHAQVVGGTFELSGNGWLLLEETFALMLG